MVRAVLVASIMNVKVYEPLSDVELANRGRMISSSMPGFRHMAREASWKKSFVVR